MTVSDHADLAVGFELPAFQRTVGFAIWNRYAAVNDEFVPIHMDDAAGREAGYPSAFGMGNLQIAYLHCLLRGWLDGRGRVRNLAVRFRGPALRGSDNIAGGVITAVHADEPNPVVELDIWVDDGAGEHLTSGTAVVVVDAIGATGV